MPQFIQAIVDFFVHTCISFYQVIIDFLVYILPYLYQGLEWFFLTVIVKYIVVHWIADVTLKGFKKGIVQTKLHAAYWLHYRERAMGHSHQAATPELCPDGACKVIKPL